MMTNTSQLPRVIYLMGAPGAGKGTQAKLLCEEIGYVQFSTGDAFREIARQDTDLGRRVKNTIDNGILAPPEMAAEIVMAAVEKHMVAGDGLVFDGTPRTVAEAKVVDQFFKDKGYGEPLVMFLAVDKEEMMRRNSQRRYCLGIAGDFPVVTAEDEQRCADKGGTIGTRPDDEPEKFTMRWNEFMNQTHVVVEGYRTQGRVHEIDGMQPVEEVHQAVMQVVNEARV